MYISQTKVAAGVAEDQALMVESEDVQDRRVKVVYVDRVLLDAIPDIVRPSIHDPRFDSAAGKPARKRRRVMVATLRPFAILCPGSPAKLGTEYEQRVVEQATLL